MYTNPAQRLMTADTGYTADDLHHALPEVCKFFRAVTGHPAARGLDQEVLKTSRAGSSLVGSGLGVLAISRGGIASGREVSKSHGMG